MTDYNSNPMGYEDELKILIRMSLPAIFSMLIQSVYNVVDSYFVSSISEKALRAVSLSYPIHLLLIAFGIGTSIGVNSYISRQLGAKNFEKANEGAKNGYFLILLTWFAFIVFRFTTIDSFYHLFTDDPEVISAGQDYLGTVTLFSIFLFSQVMSEKVLQATGNMKVPMKSHLISALTNIVLDPLMIHGYLFFPKLGVKGAAIATVFSQFVGFMYIVPYILKNKEHIDVNFVGFRPNLSIIKKIYEVGLPSILMNSIASVLQILFNLIISNVNEYAVTVNGIYTKLLSFVTMPIFGLGQGFMPLIGYNYGARNKARIKKIYKYGLSISYLFAFIGLAVFQLLPGQLIGIFSDLEEVVDIGIPALRIVSLSFIFIALNIVNSTFFQGLGIGYYSLIVTALRQFVIILPLAWYLSRYSIDAVWISFPVAEFVSAILSVYYYKKVMDTRVNQIV